MKEKDAIYFSEWNYHGGLVIYGIIGIRQYYDYTKRQAYALYIKECHGKVFYND